jgi:hypothetical protein
LRNGSRIDLDGFPPSSLIAAIVELTVMPAAQGHGEFIADFAPERTWFGEAEVMSF